MAAQVQAGLGGVASGYRTVYAIFEGGGARGITHIGALKALEKENLALVGVAGSSAGAIIAALAAVGYTPDELFSGDGKRDILSSQKPPQSPLDLVGFEDWNQFQTLKLALRPAFVALGIAILALVASVTWSPVGLVFAAVFAIIFAFQSRPFAWAARRILAKRGLFSTVAMRDKLNELLRAKLLQHYKDLGKSAKALPKQIRFKDMDPAEVDRCCRLKIIVSDTRSGQLVMFDHRDEHVVVADAVAASAAIPLAFEPPHVRGTELDTEPVFVDGGLVSNLPAWSFRSEKRSLEREQGGPPVPIIAFTLTEGSHPSAEAGAGEGTRLRQLQRFIVDVLKTGIFGSQAIVQDFVSDLVIIELPSPLTTLAFDCNRDEATAAYNTGLDEAGRQLVRRRQIAELTAHALNAVLDDATAEISRRRQAKGRAVPHLRAALVDPVGRRPDDPRAAALKVTATANMDDDADDRLEIDLRNGIAPRAYSERRPIYGKTKKCSARDLWMTKYEHALLRRQLCGVICVPVYARATKAGRTSPQRVLCLDSSDELKEEFEDTKFMAMLTAASATVSRTLIEEIIDGTNP